MASLPWNKVEKYDFGHFGRNTVELLSINWTTVRSGSSTGSHGYGFVDCYINVIDVGLTVCVIDLNDHLDKFARHVTILFKMNVSAGNTLAQTATTCDLACWGFVLTFNHSGLPQGDLSWEFNLLIFLHTFDGDSHMINNHTFFSGCDVAEWCWPSFKSLETEWETVLAWRKAIALIN